MPDEQTLQADGPRLRRLQLAGFRSIEDCTVDFGDMNVLIGPNGAGKSNLIGFFRMLGFMLSTEQGLATYVGLSGGASTLLHDGPKRTPQLTAHLEVETTSGLNEYKFRLAQAADDSLIYVEEQCRFSAANKDSVAPWINLGAGHRAPKLLTFPPDSLNRTPRTILHLLRGLQVYQFHDTSTEARVKQRWSLDQNRHLRGDGGNLAPFLLNMRDRQPLYYHRIVETLRQVAPFFDDFILVPEYGNVLLRWREVGADLDFGPGQMSDGTLRAILLITLLLQPQGSMPRMIIIDEPELGLHPFAARIIAGLIRSASVSQQCLIATQSPEFLNEFDAGDVVIVEREGRASCFRRLKEADLKRWLDEYSLSELWDMNILGGRPRSAFAE